MATRRILNLILRLLGLLCDWQRREIQLNPIQMPRNEPTVGQVPNGITGFSVIDGVTWRNPGKYDATTLMVDEGDAGIITRRGRIKPFWDFHDQFNLIGH